MTSLLTDPDRSRTREVTFDVTLRDGTVQRVDGADAYEPERSMTTFFRTDGRPTVDCWSVRMASFRTDEILAIRRLEDVEVGAEPALRIV
ncbi:MAG TPA: hypothetical protein P5193_11635 [Microthrixaceae bacterium]|jgi:hypothetical protein|nr:hypothetical protein [Microthrixaceae bacterium]MCB9399825.1 hypothetical protein [Microthrixaceae bacterium]MCO5305733.1 hypothetical protein [Microthrixaceae bacterium]HMR94300.1 hypothetical protein [Microthrixaceae bacterium]HMV74442.1 hypothetical protein [Microthrixaceae bacterium]